MDDSTSIPRSDSAATESNASEMRAVESRAIATELPAGALPAARLRPAEPRDVPAIVGLIRELAEFEQLTHLVRVTADTLHPHLFGTRPVVEALVAEVDGQVVAFALYFTNFSTFLSKPGLYLEDLYVQPTHRKSGIGRGLLIRLAAIALERDYGRFEWCVLDWNVDAIGFYERMGASVLPDWRICRVTGEALHALASTIPPSHPALST